MKKFSDIFSGLVQLINNVGRRAAITALFMVAAITMGFAQEPYVFTEGSVHHFSVAPNSDNKFVWGMYLDENAGIPMLPDTYDLMDGGTSPNLTIRFNDMNRLNTELVYLVVEETNPSGCSTRRSLQIQLEPNNMYLEFAENKTQDCFNLSDYQAPLKIGLNFKDKAGGVPIPESFFPLKVIYTVENKTAGTLPVLGNGGDSLTITFNSANDYFLMVKMPEAVGVPDKTTEYELVITSVTDKYQTDITNNSGDIRIQIRVINHLPQSGNMDMALAYYIINP
jgi:hypothetical protein